MTKLEITSKELEKLKVFDGKLNQVTELFVRMIGLDIPREMSLGIANFTMSSFAGHFHPKIKIAADNLVPPNMIGFVLAQSGAKKTSSMLNMEKALKCGYEIINNKRLELEKIRAAEVDSDPRPINPLSNALATEAGMIQRLNDFHEEGLGLPSMFVDEISTELATNPDMIPNIKLVAQLFDVGEMKSKPLKDREMQSDEVNGMGMTALFMGSEHGILEDDSVLKRFLDEFISKLARRCFFIFPEFEKKTESYSDMDDIFKELDQEEVDSKGIALELNKLSSRMAISYIDQDINIINVSDEAMRLYKIYKIYCEGLAEKIIDEPLHLEQKHRHWKAFKLSAVYSMFNENDEITFDDLKEAINTAELTSEHLGVFLEKAKRETYEVLVEHFLKGGETLTVHEMIKMGWIKKQSNLKDMIISANSKLGTTGRIDEHSDKVFYDEFEAVDKNAIHASFKVLPPMATQKYVDQGMEYPEAKRKAKDERGRLINDKFTYKETTFLKLGKLLTNDCAYTPFKFLDKREGATFNPAVVGDNPEGGIRNKDNIASGAQFVVLDVDDADVTIEEASDMLQDYRYLMARTSDPDNPYKFRVILPIDVVIRVERGKWRLFMAAVAEHLGIEIDILPQSQIFYGFKDREVIINEDGELLEASQIIKNIEEPVKVISQVPAAQRARLWQDRNNEFAYAYRATSGSGLHLSLFKAMRHAYDLGFSIEDNIAITNDICNFREDQVRPSYMTSLDSQRNQKYNIKEY